MTDSSKLAPTGPIEHPASTRELVAWAFYDFANSGYTTVVLTTIYSAYFVGVIAARLDQQSPGTAMLLWTLSIGAANLLVLFAGPVIGAIADQRASKKRYLLLSSIVCVTGTIGLALVGSNAVVPAMLLLVLATIAFSLGENLIAAFLPEIAHRDGMGRVSGYGWSLGYFGGLLTLSACLMYINWATEQGLEATDYVPVALLITAAIFAITACPTFLAARARSGKATYCRCVLSQSRVQPGAQHIAACSTDARPISFLAVPHPVSGRRCHGRRGRRHLRPRSDGV